MLLSGQEIQSLLLNWKGPDLTTYGELVLEGTFRVQRVRNERTFFLFDKTLLITKKRGDHFIYKSHIPVPCCSHKQPHTPLWHLVDGGGFQGPLSQVSGSEGMCLGTSLARLSCCSLVG